MVLMTYVLMGSVAAGAVNSEIDKLACPAGVTRTIQEVRYYCSLPADTRVQLLLGTEVIYTFEAQVNDYYKLPYPGNLKMTTGDELRLVCTNRNTTTASTVKVEIVVEETRAK
jgi:hypothetical protein